MLFIGLIENALGTGQVENWYMASTLACSMRELPPMPGTLNRKLPVKMQMSADRELL
jgi:hypothetical protein